MNFDKRGEGMFAQLIIEWPQHSFLGGKRQVSLSLHYKKYSLKFILDFLVTGSNFVETVRKVSLIKAFL